MDFFSAASLTAFLQVVAIDLVLAGDNAIVIGLAAAGVPAHQRNKAILIGIVAATVLRIIFAISTTYLLAVPGLRLVGGLMLAFVCWNMWKELRHAANQPENHSSETLDAKPKTLLQAAFQIIVADLSMSLDNVLAVAGAAHDNIPVLIAGLIISIALMGLAANAVASLLNRYRWISYLGLAVIVYVAANMLYHGAHELTPYLTN